MSKEFDPSAPAAKGYETPTYDRLRPRWKQYVLHFSKYGDEEQAAVAAGYSKKTAAIYGFEMGRHPDVVKALEEMQARAMNAGEFSRSATIARLRSESVVAMVDLCHEVEYTYEGEKRTKWKPRPPESILPQFRSCTGLITVTREGHAQFNTTAQNKSRELLAKYMKWDRENADVAPPISFNFSGLKDPQ